MTKVTTFANETEARMSHDLLAARGVHAQVIGAKEYTAHVLGGGVGRYELLVEDYDVEKARAVLDEVARRGVLSSESPLPPNHFARSVIFGCAAIFMLPGIFTLVSLMNAKFYWTQSRHDPGARLKLAMLLILQIPSLAMLYFLSRNWQSLLP